MTLPLNHENNVVIVGVGTQYLPKTTTKLVDFLNPGLNVLLHLKWLHYNYSVWNLPCFQKLMKIQHLSPKGSVLELHWISPCSDFLHSNKTRGANSNDELFSSLRLSFSSDTSGILIWALLCVTWLGRKKSQLCFFFSIENSFWLPKQLEQKGTTSTRPLTICPLTTCPLWLHPIGRSGACPLVRT